MLGAARQHPLHSIMVFDQLVSVRDIGQSPLRVDRLIVWFSSDELAGAIGGLASTTVVVERMS